MRVIGELATAQGKVQQATHEVEEKLTTLTAQGVKEIVETKKKIIKEVEEAKEASKKFI
jgi:hypothetical protein